MLMIIPAFDLARTTSGVSTILVYLSFTTGVDRRTVSEDMLGILDSQYFRRPFRHPADAT